MLASDDVVRSVIIDGRLTAEAPRGLVHVNLATISVALARELAGLHDARGIGYVAAPVFGRPDAAAAGKLHIVVAGDPASIARVQPLSMRWARRRGSSGAEPYRANVVKLAGNFMIASAIETMGEAAAMAEGNGVAAAELLDVLTNALFHGAVVQELRRHHRRPSATSRRVSSRLGAQGRATGARSRRSGPHPIALRQSAARQLAGSDRSRTIGPGLVCRRRGRAAARWARGTARRQTGIGLTAADAGPGGL